MSNNKDFKVKNSIKPTVYHEAVGTVVSGAEGYYFSGGSYDSVSFSVSGQDADPYGLFFRSDGAKMYVAGDAGNDINEYNLSTPWTVSSASYSQNFSVASQESAPNGVFFKTDGTKMFVVGTATDTVYEYALSSAWDISSASYGSVSFSVGSQDTAPTDLAFKTDGTKMFIVGKTGDNVYEYGLSSAWVVSSASYTRSFSLASQETGPTGLFFSSDGLNMVVVGAAGVNKYVLSSAWDISTASYSQAFSVSSQEGDPQALFFKSDGTKMYVLGSSNDTIYQYSTALSTAQLDLSTGSVFDYTPTSDVQVTLTNPAASGTSSGATLLLSGGGSAGYDLANGSYSNKSFLVSDNAKGVSFSANGTKMFVAFSLEIREYNLSVAYDVSSSVYNSVSFSVPNCNGMFINEAGNKMYILNPSTGNIEQYSLSTAFDLSTASYDLITFSYTSQESTASGVVFNPDGTKMYIVGYGTRTVYQYSLSTAYNISTASYDSVSFSTASQDTFPTNLAISNDGFAFYVMGNSTEKVYEYNMSSAYDLSTASYNSIYLDVSSQTTASEVLFFSPDGKIMYVGDTTDDTIYQYSTATPATITYDSALQWSGGTAPTSPAIGETDVITFNTTDGGTTYKSALAIDGAK